MVSAMFERLRVLQFEHYVARQIKDTRRQKQIQRKINKLEKEIEEAVKNKSEE